MLKTIPKWGEQAMRDFYQDAIKPFTGKEKMEEIREVIVKKEVFDVILYPDLEDGGYWVECPSLPGCASQGDTVEEALAMIKDSIEGHLKMINEEK